MFTRRTLVTGLGGALVAGPMWGQTSAPGGGAFVDDPRFIIDTSVDANRRMTVPVLLDGQGPFNFVVDTGADRTVISESLAARLNMPSGPNVLVHGIAGSIPAPTRVAATMSFGKTQLRRIVLPVLSGGHLGADGLLGVDALKGRTVFMDFRRGTLSVQAPISRTMRARAPDETVVSASTAFGRLTVVDTRVDGVRTTAFMDSGGGVTIGNFALAAAIRRRIRATDPDAGVRLVSVTGQAVTGFARMVRAIDIDAIRLTQIPMAFCDLPIFDRWGLRNRPTMLVGVDVMRMFSRVELDFSNRAVLFKVGSVHSPNPAQMQARLGNAGLVG